MTLRTSISALACAFAVAATLLTSGCVTQPTASVSNDAMPFEQAIATATDALVAQTQTLPAFLAKVDAKLNKRAVVLDPTLDAGTGQQTAATQLLDKTLTDRIGTKFEQFEVLPFRAANLTKAQYLLTGTLTRAPQAYRLNLALTDLKSGNVVAQSSALARDSGVDMSPLPYYRDSPVLVKDKVIDGYVRTTVTPPGQRGDTVYLERIATATLINEATLLYNAEKYQEALGQYRSALATPCLLYT